MVKQADGWESGLTKARHMLFAKRSSKQAMDTEAPRIMRWLADEIAIAAEYHEACAEGRTTAATEDE